jgi:class 3 adenylate cyclase
MTVARALCPVLVGRDAELSALEDSLLSALRGEGGVVVLGGEAGLGKSRLVSELMSRAQRIGCAVMFGTCSEADIALPYLPFVEAIGNHLSGVDVPALGRRLGAAGEELAQLFPQFGSGRSSGGDALQSKLRLFEAIVVLLREAARERALLLVLEDLHWAERSTRELVDYLTRRLRPTNVLVVATYRSDEMHRKHPLLPTIQSWRRSDQVQVIQLDPLGPEQVATMVSAIFDQTSVGTEFRDFIHQRTEGNPFVIEEMLKASLDHGDIFRTEGDWDRKPLNEFRIPDTVRDTILLRIERLGSDVADVIGAASVAGSSFDARLLTSLSGKDDSSVLEAVQTCVLHQLLEEEDSRAGTYRFRHALTREAVYEDIVVPKRQQLHSRLADILSTLPDHRPVERANHLLAAGRFDEAVPLCIAAAEEAGHALAYHDAALLLERAALHTREPRLHAQLLCRAGNEYWNNAEPGQGRRALEQGVAELDEAGLVKEAAVQRLMLGRCYWELQLPDRAAAEFERARAVLEDDGPSEALAIAYIRLSGLAGFSLRPEQSLRYAERALQIAREVDAGLPMAWSLNFKALAEIDLGRVEEGFQHIDESFRLAREGGHLFQAGNATYNATYQALHLGRGRLARRWVERHGREQVRDRATTWLAYVEGTLFLSEGSVSNALEALRKSVDRAQQSGHEKLHWRGLVGLAHALAESDRGEEAAALLPPLSSRVEAQDVIYDGAARIRTQLSLRNAKGALEMARSIPPAACHLGSPVDAVSETAGPAEAPWLRDFIAALPARGALQGSPRLAVAKGRLAVLEGRFDDAIAQLGAAEAAFRDENMLLDAWHAGRALAAAEAKAGREESARQRLDRIVTEATTAGAHLAARLAAETAGRMGLAITQPQARPEQSVDGAAPPPVIATGERLVSVLFADVRGYTELARERTPAALADLVATLQRWAAQEVTRQRGLVDKFAGDAVMATFNVSGLSVDHTLHALQAAIAIRDKAALLGLPVGVGIAVGPAVVGNLAQGANVSVIGETTNLAARLQAASGAGEITLSEEAHRRLVPWLSSRELEAEPIELELKGMEGRVRAYRLAAPRVSSDAPSRSVTAIS